MGLDAEAQFHIAAIKPPANGSFAVVQRAATIGLWMTFGVMVVIFGVAIGGAMSGLPDFPRQSLGPKPAMTLAAGILDPG